MSGKTALLVTLGTILALATASCGEKTPHAPSCTYSVSSSTQAFNAVGGTGTAAIATSSGCSWTVTTDSPWVSISAPSGSGPATISFTVAANGVTASRKATLTLAGQTLSISQDGRAPCEYTVSPSSIDVLAAGGQASVTITAPPGCDWSATTTESWVAGITPAAGSGSGTVSFVASPNAGASDRTATLLVAGRTVLLRQAGVAVPPQPVTCEYSVSPVDVVEHWHGTGISVSVTTAAGCRWTASVSEPWLDFSRTGGDGPGTVDISHAQFTDDGTRLGVVQLRWPTSTAGQNVRVTQEGCRYGVAPALTFTAAGGSGFVTVVTQAISPSCAIGCPWTATSSVSWIHVTSSMPRAGDDAFSYQVEANPGGQRVGTITVAGRLHTVTQAGS